MKTNIITLVICFLIIILFGFSAVKSESIPYKTNKRKVVAIYGNYQHSTMMFSEGTNYTVIKTEKGKEDVATSTFYKRCDGVGDYYYDIEYNENIWRKLSLALALPMIIITFIVIGVIVDVIDHLPV